MIAQTQLWGFPSQFLLYFQEVYPYYSLPFCKPDHGILTEKRPSGIGEILEGYELRNSGFKMHFSRRLIVSSKKLLSNWSFSPYRKRCPGRRVWCGAWWEHCSCLWIRHRSPGNYFVIVICSEAWCLCLQYWYELVLDDLPMWGMVGETLRDEVHGKMEKVSFFNFEETIVIFFLQAYFYTSKP
jgi:hypothetical protein